MLHNETSVGLNDVVDILIVSTMLYLALRVLQSSTNRTLVLGGGGLLALYVIARTYGLFLTEVVLRTGAIVLIVALAIAFQEDMRRTLRRMRYSRFFDLFRPAAGSHRELTFDPLVETAFQLASNHTGALIVVQGRESLEMHLRGGIEISAPINVVLMQSIFDAHSPGHDGAVIIHREMILRMCVHLPLSQQIDKIGTRGTRHSAGLGLSEVSDALAIIVSEEHGDVSIAEGGRLLTVTSPAQLKQSLENFSAQRFATPSKSLSRPAWMQHLRLKALSVGIATIAWSVFASHSETVQKTFIVPVEYRNVAAGFRLGDDAHSQIRLTLSGHDPAFALLAPSTLKATVDMSGRGLGDVTIQMTERNCVRPANLQVYGIEPRVLRLQLITVEQPPMAKKP